jgi:hypothetical protein
MEKDSGKREEKIKFSHKLFRIKLNVNCAYKIWLQVEQWAGIQAGICDRQAAIIIRHELREWG